MSILQSQHEARVQSDAPHQGVSLNTNGVVSVTQEDLSCNVPSSESQTLHDTKEVSSKPDPENGMTKLTGKYAKYAGEPPDGGLKAWSVILGTGLTTCSALGFVNAWGIFQEYYEEKMLPNDSPSNIAWIGSMQYALVFLPGLVTGRLFDLGYFKIPYLFASCLLVACTFLIAECKVYWQFVLAQGLGVGLASGILFGPALSIVSHWFSKRRGLALGINAMGSSLGGTIFPIIAQNLFPKIGFQWTVRIFGFMLMLFLGVANLTMDRRLPPMKVEGGLFNWAALKNPTYAVYCLSGVTTFLGLFTGCWSSTLLTYIPISAIQAGIPSDFALYLIAIANGSSAFGRMCSGIFADRFGSISVMAPCVAASGAMTFAWPFVTSKGGLIAIAVVYGFACGSYVSLLAIPAMAMGAIGDVGRRTGLFLSLAALGALTGTPISGAINSATGSFEGGGLYAGGILLFSAFLLMLTRYLHIGKWMGKF